MGDGAMGTQLYAKGVYINRCFEALNLENSDLVAQVHREYLEAGAELIETNTFGANRSRLASFDLQNRVREINQKAVEIAKTALQQSAKPAWIAGSLGPLLENTFPFGRLSESETQEIYAEQIQALVDANVDLLILETFTHLPQLKAAVRVARQLSSKPVVAMLTVNDHKQSALGEDLPLISTVFESLDADVVGFNCSSGPAAILGILEDPRFKVHKTLAAFPNAGHPRNVYGRTMYLATPEYFGNFAKKLIQKGVNLIGGCCGTSPQHIRRTRESLAGLRAAARSESFGLSTEKLRLSHIKKAEPKSRLAKSLAAGKFVVSVEIDPPRGTDLRKVMAAAERCAKAGIDAINIADGPRASARMDPRSLGVLFQQKFGIETIIHFCCRDRNLLGLQNDLLGAHALGIQNILCITGDPLKLGDYPEATGVFDIDAIGLSQLVQGLNQGLDLAGHDIGEPTNFFAGVGCNPAALNLDREMERLEKKLAAGAEYILTQPVYDRKTFENFLNRFRKMGLKTPILIGICPLASLRNAQFLHNEVPGMQIPEEILSRMEKAEGQSQEGIKIAREALFEFRQEVQGTYIMPPFNRAETALAVVKDIHLSQ